MKTAAREFLPANSLQTVSFIHKSLFAPTGALVLMMHPAPRRADYERVFVGVNSDADIISGALFKLSGTLF